MMRSLLPLFFLTATGCVSAAEIAEWRGKIADARGALKDAKEAVIEGKAMAEAIKKNLPAANERIQEIARADTDAEPFAKDFDEFVKILVELAGKALPKIDKVLETIDKADRILERLDGYLEKIGKLPALFEGIKNAVADGDGIFGTAAKILLGGGIPALSLVTKL